MKQVYILQLQNNKWYCGSSENYKKRIEQHYAGTATEWTRIHKPISLFSHTKGDEGDEELTTLRLMGKHGIDNVRGGSFSRVKFKPAEIEIIQNQIRSINNECYKCGSKAHKASSCDYVALCKDCFNPSPESPHYNLNPLERAITYSHKKCRNQALDMGYELDSNVDDIFDNDIYDLTIGASNRELIWFAIKDFDINKIKFYSTKFNIAEYDIDCMLLINDVISNNKINDAQCLECIKLLRDCGCNWNEWTCATAAHRGRADVLKYLHDNGCPWDENTTRCAAKYGRLNCLKYVCENGCDRNDMICISHAIENKDFELLEYITKLEYDWKSCDPCIFAFAAKSGNFDVLKWLYAAGCPWTSYMYICTDDPDIITWLQDKSCPQDTFDSVNDQDVIEQLQENSQDASSTIICSYSFSDELKLKCLNKILNHAHYVTEVCTFVAYQGELECLQFVIKCGGIWNEDTCAAAAYSGNIECLKYAHENGCPWDIQTLASAAYNGHYECLEYAYENGCPRNLSVSVSPIYSKHIDCLKYASGKGCFALKLSPTRKELDRYIRTKLGQTIFFDCTCPADLLENFECSCQASEKQDHLRIDYDSINSDNYKTNNDTITKIFSNDFAGCNVIISSCKGSVFGDVRVEKKFNTGSEISTCSRKCNIFGFGYPNSRHGKIIFDAGSGTVEIVRELIDYCNTPIFRPEYLLDS